MTDFMNDILKPIIDTHNLQLLGPREFERRQAASETRAEDQQEKKRSYVAVAGNMGVTMVEFDNDN